MGCKSWMLFSRISVSTHDSLRKRASHVRNDHPPLMLINGKSSAGELALQVACHLCFAEFGNAKEKAHWAALHGRPNRNRDGDKATTVALLSRSLTDRLVRLPGAA